MSIKRVLDRRPRHDERSRNYPVRGLIRGTPEIKPKNWYAGAILDQGSEGSCVGHGWTTELMASPKPSRFTDSDEGHAYAVALYKRAQQIDEWEGEDYGGTSVLAGAQVVQERGLIDEYRWAFSMDDVRDAILTQGPVVIGVPWYESMYDTDTNGWVEVWGPQVGGHCLVLTGYHPAKRKKGDGEVEAYKWRNSWGAAYGINGSAWIAAEQLETLLHSDGDACVPIGRHPSRVSLEEAQV